MSFVHPHPEREGSHGRLVQQAFIEALAKRGIPADWVQCRALPTQLPSGEPALHVQFVVRQAGDRLLPQHAALEESFLRSARARDPLSRRWILGVAWVLEDRTPAAPTAWRIDRREPVAA